MILLKVAIYCSKAKNENILNVTTFNIHPPMGTERVSIVTTLSPLSDDITAGFYNEGTLVILLLLELLLYTFVINNEYKSCLFIEIMTF